MKKIFTLLSLIVAGSVVVAQSAHNTTERATTKKSVLERAISAPTENYSGSRTDIYTEDFDGGLPADWTVETVSGPCSWEWTNTGHNGDFPSAPLASTTAGNGWMVLDSDLCGADGGSIEVSYLYSPSIDLSEYPAVSVGFEQYFRSFPPAAEITTIELSIDGGNSWTSYQLNIGIGQEGTPNPDIVQVNISDIAGGESDVQFRFGWSATWGYGWQIDDFSVFVPNDYNLTISGTDYQYEWLSENEDTYRDLAYTVYHTSQVREMNFRATITNNGGQPQSDVALQVTIEGGDAPVVLTSAETLDLQPAQSGTLTIPNWFPTVGVGSYTIEYSTVQENEDEDPEDNVAAGSFEISDGIYARDLGFRASEFSNFDDDHKVGTSFYIENAATLYCVGVALSSNSNPGTSYNVELLDAFSLSYLNETVIAEVPEQGLLNEIGESKWEWLDMTAPFNLIVGEDYVVAMNHFGGDDLAILGLSGTSPAQTSFIYEGSEETWYYITSTPMIRMGLSDEFCSSVSVEEPVFATMNNLFPNPTTGQTTVEYTLLETANVQLMLFDNMGRIVWSADKGNQPVGEYRFNNDFSHIASGMYTFSIRVGDKAFNKKLVIE